MIDTFIPAASNISEASYDDETQTLTVVFQDSRAYEYSGVPQGVWVNFKSAGGNAGSFFYRNIRSHYPYSEA